MNKKIKITAIQEPAIRYITTDGEKFEDPIRAKDHQYEIDTKNERKKCYEKYGIMTNMDILAPSDQIVKECPEILYYLIPGFDPDYHDFVILKTNTINEVDEIFAAFKNAMNEIKKDSLLESFIMDGTFPCTFVFCRDCSTSKFSWLRLEKGIEKMKKAVIDAKQKLSLNI